MAAAAGSASPHKLGAALGGSKSNPSASGPSLRPSGKPVALADITNTGRPNPPRSVSVGDVLKENAKLAHLLAEKNKIIEITSAEMHKLRFALHSTRQQNLILAQANSQILAELNQGKDRLKALQHELGCATAMLKLKASELERNNNASNQQKDVTLQEIKVAPSKLAPIEAYQADNDDTSADVHHLVEPESAVPSNTVHQEPPPDKTNKRTSTSRRTNKRKSESCEATEDSKTVQHSYKPHEDLRTNVIENTLRRRSSRLNPGSCEMTDVSCETLHKATVVPSASSLSVLKLHEPNSGKDTLKSKQDELLHNAAAPASILKVKASELKNNGINKQPPKEVIVEEEIQEAHSGAAGVEGPEAHPNDDKATGTNQNIFAKTQSSLPFNIQHPEPPQERANKRAANKRKLESCEGQKDSNIEDIHSRSIEPLHHEETRKSIRRKSARQNPGSCEVTRGILETALEDGIAPLAPSSSNVLVEQRRNEKQNDCCSKEHATGVRESAQEDDIAPPAPSNSNVLIEQGKKEKQNDSRSSMEPSGQQVTGRSSSQVTGRRSSVRAAGKAVSYKEIPVNVKMRRP